MRFVKGGYVSTITLQPLASAYNPTPHVVDAQKIKGLPVDVSAKGDGKALIYSGGEIVFGTVSGGGSSCECEALTVTGDDADGIITFNSESGSFEFDSGIYTGNNGIFCGGIQSCGGSGDGSFLSDVTSIGMRESGNITMNDGSLEGVGMIQMKDGGGEINLVGGNLTNVAILAGVSGEGYDPISIFGQIYRHGYDIYMGTPEGEEEQIGGSIEMVGGNIDMGGGTLTSVILGDWRVGIRTVTEDTTLTTTDEIVLVDATDDPVNITLPAAEESDGQRFSVKKIDSSSNAVTLVGTIDGDTNLGTIVQWTCYTVASDGTAWYVV